MDKFVVIIPLSILIMGIIKWLAVSFVIVLSLSTNKGMAQADTAFWFAAPAITPGHAHEPIVLRFASYGQPATITITEPADSLFALAQTVRQR